MKKAMMLAASGAFVVLAAAFLMINGKSKKIFASDTTVNEMDVSGMTKEDLEQEIQGYFLTVTFWNEQGEKTSEIIKGADFDIKLGKNAEEVFNILKKQDAWEYLTGGGESYKLDGFIEYDETKLVSAAKQLACFDAGRFIEPEDAYISKYSKENGYQIVKETSGNVIDEKRAQAKIIEAVRSMEKTIDLTEADCYRKAAVTSENARLNRILEQLNTYAGTKITYRFDSKKEILDGETISKWLKVSKKGKVKIQKQKIAQYVSKLRRKYDTIFSRRKFRTSYGKTVTVIGGDYGWWMNTEKEEKELFKLIKAGKKAKRIPEYYQTAESYGKRDYGDSYVEVNLATQHVFLYVKGKKILETDCVTGNSSRGYETPTGTYSITYTERNATLNGENYSTPVQYWMPFNRNIGLHDASWRSSFGGEIYKYNGSHGCINLPSDKAAKLFGHVKKGMPVVCYYYLPEKNKETKQNRNLVKKNNKTNKSSAVKKEDAVKKNNETKKSSTEKKDRAVKKNNQTRKSSTEKKDRTVKENNETKKSSTEKKDRAVKKNNQTRKSSTEKKDRTVKKNNRTKKSSTAKKNHAVKKNTAVAKKNDTEVRNSTKRASVVKKKTVQKQDKNLSRFRMEESG